MNKPETAHAETHTPGKLKIGHGGMPDDSGFSILSDNAGSVNVRVVAECWPCTFVSEDHRREVIGNGHRLVACWNALTGLDPAALPGLLRLAEMVQERINRDGSTEKTPYGSPWFAEIRKLADEATQTGATHD